MSKHIIQTINFNIYQQENPLIANLNWMVDESEFIEITGLNHTGKTTLLNAIYGHPGNSSGQLFVLDYSMMPVSKGDLATLRRKLGYAKQGSNLVENKTVRANLAMALNAADRITDLDSESQIEELLDRFSLKDCIRREVRELSYSQQHLTALARALVHRPKLLLMDQSLDLLDDKYRRQVLEIIQSYRVSERMTIISTSLYGWAKEITSCKSMKLVNGSLITAE
jgi:ABC-type lipoprotein export system ATPase subunit